MANQDQTGSVLGWEHGGWGASTRALTNEVTSLCSLRLSYLPAFIHPRSNNVDKVQQTTWTTCMRRSRQEPQWGCIHHKLNMGLSFFFAWFLIGSLGPALEKYPREEKKDPPLD